MMKKQLSFFCLFLLAAVLLSNCSSWNLISLKKNDQGLLVNTSVGLSYQSMPSCFEPIKTLQEYASYSKRNVILYEIEGLDPQKWLSEEFNGIGSVFCSSEIQIPTLSTFAPNQFYICIYGEVIISLAEVTDQEMISKVVDLFENGELAERPFSTLIDSYQLKFISKQYPGLYYNLLYYVYEDGSYLYDRSSQKFIRADGLLDDYLSSSAS